MKLIITEKQFDQLLKINENTYTVYHTTNNDFDDFDFNKTAQGVVWFTDSLDSIKNQETGANGFGKILKRKITLNNPAGWDLYDKYSLGELVNMGYDGVILPDNSGNNFIVFHPESIKKGD